MEEKQKLKKVSIKKWRNSIISMKIRQNNNLKRIKINPKKKIKNLTKRLINHLIKRLIRN